MSAVDKFPKLKELTAFNSDKGILHFKANGVVPMWSPVVLVAPGAGETLPRIATTTTANDPTVLGVAAGGSGNVAGGNAADAALDMVDVIPIHSAAITKVVVGLGTIDSVGLYLVTGDTPGQADLAGTADVDTHILGKNLQVKTTAGDTVLVFMGGAR